MSISPIDAEACFPRCELRGAGQLQLSAAHVLWSRRAWQWDWVAGDTLHVHRPIAFSWRYREDGVAYVPAFGLNVYCDVPQSGEIVVTVGGASFSFGLEFTGWRAGLVRYHGDMRGTPPEQADGFQILAPSSGSGRIWLDGIVPDGRSYEALPMPDRQLPCVADGGDEHRGPGILRTHLTVFRMPPPAGSAAEPPADTVADRLLTRLLAVPEPKVDAAMAALQALDLAGTRPVIRHNTQVAHVERRPAVMTVKAASQVLLDLALAYRATGDTSCRDGYLQLSRYLMDQGWVAESSLGTLHLLGYHLAPYCRAHFLMRDVLADAGLLHDTAAAMQWLTNARECQLLPPHDCDLDYLHTFAMNQLIALLMTPDPQVRAAWLRAFVRFIDARLALQTDDDMDGFKWDGGAFHHFGHYPAYAAGALEEVAALRVLLHGTPFALDERGVDRARHSARIMCAAIMGGSYPNAVCGRHPFRAGRGWPPQILAAAAALGCEPTPATAFVAVNTAALAIVRRPGFLVAMKGLSRFVWGSEIFPGAANRYGAFQGHGSVEILLAGGLEASGYAPDGWDWRHVPGATTCRAPYDTLKDLGNRRYSSESFAGALTLDGENGQFAVVLQDDAFQLRARKSVFAFGDECLCLGSDISCWRNNYSTVTTLYQNVCSQPPPQAEGWGDGLQLTDAVGNSYWLDDSSDLKVDHGSLDSYDQCTAERTTGRVAIAWLDHGRRPKGSQYRYWVTVQSRRAPVIAVMQQDASAHIVRHEPSGIIAGTVFEPGDVQLDPIVRVSLPCLLQLRSGADYTEIAVGDPDLQWQRTRSADLAITLACGWQLVGEPADVTASASASGLLLSLRMDHGRPRRFRVAQVSQ